MRCAVGFVFCSCHLLHWFSRRAFTTAELMKKLRGKNYPLDVIESVIAELKSRYVFFISFSIVTAYAVPIHVWCREVLYQVQIQTAYRLIYYLSLIIYCINKRK